jgi:serine/threonine protein kinase
MGPAEPGEVLAGRYRLRAVIGRGGMGVVWLASDELLHRDVAVKEILWPPQLDAVERENLRHRALREARTAARLNHPNIVGVYDVVESDGRPWIVMQLVPYRSLSDVVRDDGPLLPQNAAQVGLGILDAIRSAHATGILHRDVKPGNVLLGPEDQVVLTDFGMAVADGSPTLTTSGILIGSPSYMAPERARGEPATVAADLWSLGATLYAAVEGRPPFERDGTMAVLTAIVSDDPDPPSRSGPLWPVISGLLHKSPGARLGAAEVERSLRGVAENYAAARGASPGETTMPLGAVGPPSSSHVVTRQHSPLPRRTPTTQRPRQGATAGSAGLEQPLIPGLESHPYAPAPEPQQPGSPAREPSQPEFPPWESSQPESPVPDKLRRRKHPALRWDFVAIGIAAVAAIAAGILAITGGPGHWLASPAASKPPHTRPSPGTSAPSTPNSATSRPNSATPGSSSEPGRLPAGFFRYHDPTGFSIGVPKGWVVSREGHLVYVREPNSGRFLIIDQTTQPKPDPLADWRQQEAARISTYPGYHRIRLQAVDYAQAERTADWEFTYYQNGQLVHVLNRNILVNAHHAYALYWSTPASEWDASFHLFRIFAATFRPVGASLGS